MCRVWKNGAGHIQKRKLWLRGNTKMHLLPSIPQYIASSNDRGRIALMRPLACEHIFGLEATHSDMAIHQRISVKNDLFPGIKLNRQNELHFRKHCDYLYIDCVSMHSYVVRA